MVQIYANYLYLLYFDSNLAVRNLNNFLESELCSYLFGFLYTQTLLRRGRVFEKHKVWCRIN